MLNKYPYQKDAKLPGNGKPKLANCPWCDNNTAAYIKSIHGIEIQCLNTNCRAIPLIGFCSGYKDYIQAAEVWNSARIFHKTTGKAQPPKDLRNFNGDFLQINKIELRNIFINNMVDRETWNKFFPERPYLDF